MRLAILRKIIIIIIIIQRSLGLRLCFCLRETIESGGCLGIYFLRAPGWGRGGGAGATADRQRAPTPTKKVTGKILVTENNTGSDVQNGRKGREKGDQRRLAGRVCVLFRSTHLFSRADSQHKRTKKIICSDEVELVARAADRVTSPRLPALLGF